MLRYILERNIEEDDVSPDEIEAIEMDDELISLEKLRRIMKRKGYKRVEYYVIKVPGHDLLVV